MTNVVAKQAIKKAKQFEVRKVARRLKAAKEGKALVKEDQGAAADKLHHQFEAAKALSIDAVAQEVRQSIIYIYTATSCPSLLLQGLGASGTKWLIKVHVASWMLQAAALFANSHSAADEGSKKLIPAQQVQGVPSASLSEYEGERCTGQLETTKIQRFNCHIECHSVSIARSISFLHCMQKHETSAVVKLRILTAKCVREAIAAARSDLEQLTWQSQSQNIEASQQDLNSGGAENGALNAHEAGAR